MRWRGRAGNIVVRTVVGSSSAARALAAGARNIERVDRLVQTVAGQKGMRLAELDAIVARVDAWLARNRAR